MPQTTVATGTFPSRKAANQAVQRLVSSGFARNSIALHPHEEEEGYDLEIHTRAENLRRAKRLINASSLGSAMNMQNVGDLASGAVRSARSHPLMLLGAGILAGFVIYNLIPRTQQEPSHSSRPQKRSGSGQRSRRTSR